MKSNCCAPPITNYSLSIGEWHFSNDKNIPKTIAPSGSVECKEIFEKIKFYGEQVYQ